LAPSAFDAWWNLYDEIAKHLRVQVTIDAKTSLLGLGEADELLADQDRDLRKQVWQATNEAWKVHDLSVAQGLNSLAGIRLKENELRSSKRPKHFLDDAFHDAGVKAETIEAMIAVARDNLPTAHKAMALIAEGMGATHYEPWDKFAPCPTSLSRQEKNSDKMTFPEAIDLVRKAFSSFHPDMGAFVDTCLADRMIEARTLPGKTPGAYSHSFLRSGKAPVFMSYSGSLDQIFTLAHELGHSLHTYSMNDLPVIQRDYPMTVAETASNVGEMLLSGYLQQQDTSKTDIVTSWADMQNGIGYLVNIPLRYEFEKALYERRQDEFLTPNDLREEMLRAHELWYGDGMETKDPMFWASKQHFHFSDISFYNFPYAFGYLFASGVYSKILEQGSDFYPAYINLLRDTGRMSAEDLAAKHLGVDLTQKDFWQTSYDIFAQKVADFERALKGN
ncbi:MAG: hypothetical protein KDD62_14595, partial [Bdellovibrionales bacterium]|nr:hypothetical protein [Bdellovibrionales bacterium]